MAEEMQIERLERLRGEATEGLWYVSHYDACYVASSAGRWIMQADREEDARLAAAAITALPALLELARAAGKLLGTGAAYYEGIPIWSDVEIGALNDIEAAYKKLVGKAADEC